MMSVDARAWAWGSAGAALVMALGLGCSSTTDDMPNPIGSVGGPQAGGTSGSLAGAGGSMVPNPMMGGAGSGSVPVGGAMPCEVETIVKNACHTCHGQIPIGGAPMSLLTLADFQKDWMVRTTTQLAGRTMKMYELARIRVNREMGTGPMPQGVAMPDADKTMLATWLSNGAPAGTACGTVGTAGTGSVGMAGTGAGGNGTAGTGEPLEPGQYNRCTGERAEEAFKRLEERPGETCYEFRVHGQSGSTTDTSPFMVPPGETYNQFYYAVPWPDGTVATRFGADFDNLQVLHHWLGFTSRASAAPGTVAREVTGTTLGESSELVGGWAVGGCQVDFPEEMGLKLPNAGDPNGKIMIQWHHNNSTGTAQPDRSAVQWCTVPEGTRPNTGGITFLGTEDFNGLLGMPPGPSKYTTACENTTNAPITIVGFTPHMHLLGTHMRSVVERVDGTFENTFDQPFGFDQQVNWLVTPSIVLQPGDTVWTTCSFNNTTGRNVAFGQPTTSEMCYQFAVAYPYGALHQGRGQLSLIGATNICWGNVVGPDIPGFTE